MLRLLVVGLRSLGFRVIKVFCSRLNLLLDSFLQVKHVLWGSKSSFPTQEFLKKINIQPDLWMQNAAGVLLYIHGYNVPYYNALKCAAQLKHDLHFGGQVILYSWPTKEKWWAYGRDGRVIQETAALLQEFITTILLEKV